MLPALHAAQSGCAIASQSLSNIANIAAAPDPLQLLPSAARLYGAMLANPLKSARDMGELWRHGAAAGLSAARAMWSGYPQAEERGRSLQYRDPAWLGSPAFAFMREAHRAYANWLEAQAQTLANGNVGDSRRLQLVARLIAESCSPENFPTTNPEVLRATRDQLGGNLMRGYANLLADLERHGWPPRVSKVDRDAFEVGKTVATTPGKVIWRGKLFELLHFQPAGETVRETPFLFVPPWINKYYILDLQPRKSMVRWLLEQGHNVFLVSWINPDEDLAEATLDDYLLDGALEAVNRVCEESGSSKVNLAGYCIGGTLLYVLLGHLAGRKDSPVSSCTFFASQADFSDAGDLMALTSEKTVNQLADRMQGDGYLSADSMAASFDMLRSADLYWHFVIRHYYLGEDLGKFDLLFWNADSTRMPACLHEQYLRWFYVENRLAKGELEAAGGRIDLASIMVPTYHVATAEDHIAPAESVYRGSRLIGGAKRFVLAGSGHIAGIINPPAPGKHGYLADGPETSENLDAWTDGAKSQDGSWWSDWAAWLDGLSGETVAAPAPGAHLGVIEDAPGSYVRMSHDA